MTIHQDLAAFVKAGLGRNLPRNQIEDVLTRAGWPGDQVKAAIGSFAEIDFPVPVPKRNPSVSAREAFLYLVLFSTLYVSAFSLGRLLFQFINLAFPDPAVLFSQAEFARQAIRWSVSSLVVAFPVFLYVSRLNSRETARDPGKRASKVRRWLTYLTLFVAAGFLMGDVTSLVYNLLGGEWTVRFLLKVLTVASIAGLVFGYYLRDLNRDESEKA